MTITGTQVWRFLHKNNEITWLGHLVLTLIIMFISYFVGFILEMNFNQRIFLGAWASYVHWLLHELGNIIPVWLATRSIDTAGPLAREKLTEKLVDGFGDFFAPMVAIALFTAVFYPLFGA